MRNIVSCLLVASIAFAGCIETRAQDVAVLSQHTPMTFTKKQVENHKKHRQSIRVVSYEDISANTPKSSDLAVAASQLNLLSLFPHDQTLWNQGSCGDCWVWGSTAVASILNSLHGNPGPLSVQYFNSSYNGGSGSSYACCGGYSEWFVQFYNSVGYFVPWSNRNANFKDGWSTCGGSTMQPASGISTTPNYPFVGIAQSTLGTMMWNESRSQAIATIKAALNQNIPIAFTFFLTNAGWSAFNNWWFNAGESSVFTGFNGYRGTDAGHLVALVGYDDADSSWILLNSWGTTAMRPSGTFKIPQSLGYAPPDSIGTVLEFDIFNISWYNTNVTIQIPSSDITVSDGATINFTGYCNNGNGQPLQYVWDFGDGCSQSSSSASASHTYHNTAGTTQPCRVTLTVNAMTNPVQPALLGKGLRTVTVNP